MMSDIRSLIEEMNEIVSDPKKTVQTQINETGKKAIGCFPVYCPEEIVYAANMLPIGMWGGQTDISLAKSYLPAFCCSIIQSCLEFGMRGVYNDLSAVIIPGHCDTLKCIGQDWLYAVPNIKCIPLVHPHNRKIEAGVTFLVKQYEKIKESIEESAGYEITDEALNESIKVYNEHRKAMRDFVKAAALHPEIITPIARHTVIKSGFFMDKAIHTDKVKELTSLINANPIKEWNGSKVIVTGIMAEPNDLLQLFEDNNIAIVGDDLAQETRQFRTDVPEGDAPLTRLAQMWSDMEGCSLLYDPEKKRGQMLIDLVEETGADGVVISMMKFCDPEEYDYPIYKTQLEKKDIPMLYVEIDQQMANNEQARTRIQAFAELLVKAAI